MPRVKIQLPETWLHRTALSVRITDVNYGGHVGNNTLLAYLQEARVDWLRTLGYASELLAPPVGLILVDIGVRLKSEAVFGDALEVRLAVSETSRTGFELAYQVVNTATGAEVARATTGFAFFDYSARRLAPAPASWPFRETGTPSGA